MIRILTCNIQKDYNFGGPCLLVGMNELINEIYSGKYVLENIQAGYERGAIEDDIPIKTVYFYPLSKRHILRFLFGYQNCMGLFALLKYIKQFDIIIDVFGICFCDDLDKGGGSNLNNRLRDFKRFTISILAKKILGKRVIKNTASYGPMEEAYNRESAAYMCSQIFETVSARENKSRLYLEENLQLKNKVLVSPDTANLMPFIKKEKPKEEIVISVSHMMKKQWKAGEDYIVCMAKTIRYIAEIRCMNVAILPNECNPRYYNDINVADEIYSLIADLASSVRVIDSTMMTCMAIKNEIASSKILIGSRYHSCVAALSAGIPVLVIGWHDKYKELLKNYGQEEWLLSNLDCSYEKLIEKFDNLSKRYEKEKLIINQKAKEVKNSVIEVGRLLYEKNS